MNLLITGGRDLADRDLVFRTLDAIHAETRIDLVIVGDASGVDAQARAWCFSRMVTSQTFAADWTTEGKKAGPMRNARMVAKAVIARAVCVAFPGGRGTADCVRQAKAAGLVVSEIDQEGSDEGGERCSR